MPTTMCRKLVCATSQEIILILSENSTSHSNMISKTDIWQHPTYCALFLRENCKNQGRANKIALNITLCHTNGMLNPKTMIFLYL